MIFSGLLLYWYCKCLSVCFWSVCVCLKLVWFTSICRATSLLHIHIYSSQVFFINPRWVGEGPLRQYDANKIKKTCTSIRAKGNDKTYTFTHVLYFFYKVIKPMPPMSLFHLFYFQRRFFWIDVQWPVFFLPFGS